MAEAILDGRLTTFVVALVVVEWLALAAWHRRTGKGLSGRQLLPNLAAGMCLMLALRAALVDSGWMWVAAFLALSGVAHVADLITRWPRRSA
jgi:hypothetical protein